VVSADGEAADGQLVGSRRCGAKRGGGGLSFRRGWRWREAFEVMEKPLAVEALAIQLARCEDSFRRSIFTDGEFCSSRCQ